MADQKIGIVTHYYDKIGVAVVKLESGDLKVGDTVKLISRDNNEFTQEVASMQIAHAAIDMAKAGDEFGLKVDSEVKISSAVVKIQ